MFKVGDYVKGTERGNDVYMYSNEFMTKAEVVSINDDETMDIEIWSHDYAFECIGDVLTVSKEDFEICQCKFISGYAHKPLTKGDKSYSATDMGSYKLSNAKSCIEKEYEKLVVLGLL
tara:strand:- start:14689 stop:15042 length:354 start_codon:yes stop_codon:yes gene_type:complete